MGIRVQDDGRVAGQAERPGERDLKMSCVAQILPTKFKAMFDIGSFSDKMQADVQDIGACSNEEAIRLCT